MDGDQLEKISGNRRHFGMFTGKTIRLAHDHDAKCVYAVIKQLNCSLSYYNICTMIKRNNWVPDVCQLVLHLYIFTTLPPTSTASFNFECWHAINLGWIIRSVDVRRELNVALITRTVYKHVTVKDCYSFRSWFKWCTNHWSSLSLYKCFKHKYI
jgi:hypothetical protein